MNNLLVVVEKLSHELTQMKKRFALAGGLALAYHGHLRATIDVDLLVVLDEKSDEETRRKLVQRGWVDANPKPLIFKKLTLTRMFFVQGREWIPIDLMWAQSALHISALRRAKKVKLQSTRVPVLEPEDLILLKKLSNRPQDKADIEVLGRLPSLDQRYLKKWLKKLKLY